jgi:hypothetical protein
MFTAQVGYAANNALFYLKGGAAVTGDRFRSLNCSYLDRFPNRHLPAAPADRSGG